MHYEQGWLTWEKGKEQIHPIEFEGVSSNMAFFKDGSEELILIKKNPLY